MSSFAIFRVAKLKGGGSLAGSASHLLRERETPNANPEVANGFLKGSPRTVAGVVEAVSARIATTGKPARKNAVVAVEVLVTASPEAMADMTREQQNQYFAKSYSFLKKKFGAENVVFGVIHRDESTPHLSALVVPIAPTGRLSATHFFDGRAKLSAMQTAFASEVGEAFGLRRGIEGSKAKHQTIKRFYGELEEAVTAASKEAGRHVDQPLLGVMDRFKAGFSAAALQELLEAFARPFREELAKVKGQLSLALQELERLSAALKRAEGPKALKSKAESAALLLRQEKERSRLLEERLRLEQGRTAFLEAKLEPEELQKEGPKGAAYDSGGPGGP